MNQPRATRPVADADQQQAERLEGTFAHCQDELLGMLYYLLGNVEDARDALQEAFVKCWRRRAELPGVQNLRAWVFRVTMNAGRDLRGTAWRRRRRPLETRQLRVVAHDNPGPEHDAVRNEQLELVRKALADLRHEEQEVFLLRQNGQLTYKQIAEAINIPVGTVKTRMRLALEKLREALPS